MANNDKQSVAMRLKLLRTEEGLTQNEIAEKLGISQQTYSKYEKGTSNVDSVILTKICNLYGVTADYVLGISAGNGDDLETLVKRVITTIKDKEDR